MSEHTPKPWAVRPNPNGTLGIDACEPDGSPCQVARINGDADDAVYGPATLANARLIAAAPELLEACEEILAHSKDFSFDPIPPGMEEQLEALVARAAGPDSSAAP